ncbi:hypothetical protein IMZ48_46590 [Candidatus Bathyarchaeota archaeon]|nr:hypothetical protein [Candidatus Bathyarchaeota archaeon]
MATLAHVGDQDGWGRVSEEGRSGANDAKDAKDASGFSEDEGDTQPLTIKELLVQLDGVFPMDQAVVDGSLTAL